jgi:D-lactate dehydrogenase
VRQFHEFHRDGLTGAECQGRTLVTVGIGHIGAEICRLGAALGMRVLGVDSIESHLEIQYASAEAALPLADVAVCAMDLNPSSRNYFSAAKLSQLKPGAIFVNVSRGEISPSQGLLAALEAGRLGGVALDVYDREPELAVALRTGRTTTDPEVAASLALAQRDDVICTPHNAFNTVESVGRKSDHSVQQVLHFLTSGRFLWSASSSPPA